jgi:hypothetical protein
MNASDNRVSELGKHIVKTVGMKKEIIILKFDQSETLVSTMINYIFSKK